MNTTIALYDATYCMCANHKNSFHLSLIPHKKVNNNIGYTIHRIINRLTLDISKDALICRNTLHAMTGEQ